MSTETYSRQELQAAAVALRSGEFAPLAPRQITRTAASVTWEPEGPWVRVLSGHSGAGASTTALALADGAAATSKVRLLDAASPPWSGLVPATTTELGADEGWRRGSRGERLTIDRLEEQVSTPAEVPAPRAFGPVALTILDTGWSCREFTAHSHGWLTGQASADVVVARSTLAGLAQAEVALAAQGTESALLFVVGASRWSGAAFASAGPRVRELRENEAIIFAPLLSARVSPGSSADPLPRNLMAAAMRLLDRLTPLTGPLAPAGHQPKEKS